ncbi:MAG: hypothetical protein ACOX5Z_05365 [Desulfobulbus sp.]
MKTVRSLFICACAFFLAGCGVTVQDSLKIKPESKMNVGNGQTVVILPFADYSGGSMATAHRRNLFVNENLIDQFVRLGFQVPVQEDVFGYLTRENIIRPTGFGASKTQRLEEELDRDWSAAMKKTLQGYIREAQRADVARTGLHSATTGLTDKAVVKVGRQFGAAYVVRGRIIENQGRQNPAWTPWERGVLPFFLGGTHQLLLGQTDASSYDTFGWDEEESSVGLVPQAVVQLRMWVQDGYTGHVVWTNRVNMRVAPESAFADQDRTALFEQATEKAISSLMNDFAHAVYRVPLPVERKGGGGVTNVAVE